MNRTSRTIKTAEAEEGKTMRDLLAPLFRHKRPVILTFSAVFAFSVFVAWYIASRYYVSEMQIVLSQTRTDPAITSAQNAAVMSTTMESDAGGHFG